MAVTEADIPRRAKDAAAVYRKWDNLISRYHAGVPEALVAVRMQIESNGKMSAPGDKTLGEVGLLQITASTEKRFGVPDCARCNAEGNVWLGCLRYSVDTAITLKRYPTLVKVANEAYLFGGMLVSAIGVGSTYWLYDRSPRGLTFKEFSDWVQAQNAAGKLASGPFGGQSPSKIAYRVKAVWIMGETAKLLERDYGISNRAAPPALPPKPSNIKSFTVPREVRGELRQLTGGETNWAPRPEDIAFWDPNSPLRWFAQPIVRFFGAALVIVGGSYGAWRLWKRGATPERKTLRPARGRST